MRIQRDNPELGESAGFPSNFRPTLMEVAEQNHLRKQYMMAKVEDQIQQVNC